MANPIEFDRFKAIRPECMHCEEMLADAVDELLSPADKMFFDRHIAGCVDCMAALADAQRGAAWLEMLKSPRPEPSAQLFDKIIAQTSGAFAGMADASPVWAEPALPGNVIPFRPRMPQWSMPQGNRWTRILFEPRLAMTAAMAFFSIALTMNLTGVRLDQMHASDLKPASVKRSFFEATASASRRYEGLRVVHTLEARVSDLRENSDGRDDRLGGMGERPESRRDLPQDPAPEPQKQPAPKPEKHEGVSRRDEPAAKFVPTAASEPTVKVEKTGGLA